MKFKSTDVEALMDLMTRDKTVGAVCARTYPLGGGPLVWYQKFEYAIGHWFQKVISIKKIPVFLVEIMCSSHLTVLRSRRGQSLHLPLICMKSGRVKYKDTGKLLKKIIIKRQSIHL